MGKAFGMCAGIAFTAACGLSQEYALPTGGNGVGIGGDNGSGGNGANGNTGSSGGNTVGGNVGTGNVGGNGVTGNGPGGNVTGNGPGGNGPGGSGPGGVGPGGSGPGGASSGGQSSAGGGNGTSAGGNGNTSGGGGCASELQPCSAMAACCATLTCEKEASAGSSFCEEGGCTGDAQCTNAQTICSGGTCALNICGGKSGNGKYNGTCVSGDEQGTCFPKGAGKNEYGICYAGGSSDGGCSDSAPKGSTELCVAGQYCVPNQHGPGEVCLPICDPGFGGGGRAVCEDAGYNGGCFPIGSLGLCFNFGP